MANRMTRLLAGLSLGAGLMYLLDPWNSRRPHAPRRGPASRRHRTAGIAAAARAEFGAGSVDDQPPGARRGLSQIPRSPTARLLVGLASGGLLAYGCARSGRGACLIGGIGLGLMASGLSGPALRDQSPGSARPLPIRGVEGWFADVARQVLSVAAGAPGTAYAAPATFPSSMCD